MEDFVPFELAVKLKEKGFNWKTLESYTNKIKQKRLMSIDSYAAVVEVDEVVNIYPKPTISKVLKWLREEKNIFVVVFIDDDSDYPITYNIFKGTDCVHHHHGKYFALSEWSKCEMAGINYVLDSLPKATMD